MNEVEARQILRKSQKLLRQEDDVYEEAPEMLLAVNRALSWALKQKELGK